MRTIWLIFLFESKLQFNLAPRHWKIGQASGFKISQPPATLGMLSLIITIKHYLKIATCNVSCTLKPLIGNEMASHFAASMMCGYKTTAANQGHSVTPKLGVDLPRVSLVAGQAMCLVSSVTWCSSLSMWCVCKKKVSESMDSTDPNWLKGRPICNDTLSQLNCTMHLSSHSIFVMEDLLSKIRT